MFVILPTDTAQTIELCQEKGHFDLPVIACPMNLQFIGQINSSTGIFHFADESSQEPFEEFEEVKNEPFIDVDLIGRTPLGTFGYYLIHKYCLQLYGDFYLLEFVDCVAGIWNEYKLFRDANAHALGL